jgi:hypothetical protein
VEASSRRDVRPKKEALKSDYKHTGIQRALITTLLQEMRYNVFDAWIDLLIWQTSLEKKLREEITSRFPAAMKEGLTKGTEFVAQYQLNRWQVLSDILGARLLTLHGLRYEGIKLMVLAIFYASCGPAATSAVRVISC